MARHYINSVGQSIKYTPRKQKEITMRALGLDINNPVDNKLYKSLYDDITRRVRQYNIIQSLDKKISPTDALFDMAFGRLKAGITITPTIKGIKQQVLSNPSSFSPTLENIYSQKLVSNTRLFAERVKANPLSYIETAIKNEENIFKAFLNTSGVDNDRAKYEAWINEDIIAYIDNDTGKLYKAEEIANKSTGEIDLKRFTATTIPRRTLISDIKEVRDYLNQLSENRRNKYKRIKLDSLAGEESGQYRYTLA